MKSVLTTMYFNFIFFSEDQIFIGSIFIFCVPNNLQFVHILDLCFDVICEPLGEGCSP